MNIRYDGEGFKVYSGKFDVNTTVFDSGIVVDPNVGVDVYQKAKVVLITHGHADHFGDAAFLRNKGAKIFAPRHEMPFVENPELNWRGMYSWARLPEKVVTPYFLGRGVKVDEFSENLKINGVKALKMPGHTPNHTAYLIDSVLVASDAVHSPDYWERFGILYYVDPNKMAISLMEMEKIDWDYLIPGHGEVFDRKEGIKVIKYNIRMLERIEKEILEIIGERVAEQEIFSTLALKYGFKGAKARIVLMPPVRGHLTDLCEKGVVEMYEEKGIIYFKVR